MFSRSIIFMEMPACGHWNAPLAHFESWAPRPRSSATTTCIVLAPQSTHEFHFEARRHRARRGLAQVANGQARQKRCTATGSADAPESPLALRVRASPALTAISDSCSTSRF
jgi:hypothetical protein